MGISFCFTSMFKEVSKIIKTVPSFYLTLFVSWLFIMTLQRRPLLGMS